IFFIPAPRGDRDTRIPACPAVGPGSAEIDKTPYRSPPAPAEMIRDPAKAEELWSNEAQAWWPRGPRDPAVRVLRVVLDQAEYWDTRGNSITVALKLMAARMSGQQPDLGENKKVNVR